MTKTTMALSAIGIFVLGVLVTLGAERFVLKQKDPRDSMTTIATLDDWRLTCPPRTSKKGFCVMQSTIAQPGTTNVVAELSVAPRNNSDVLTVLAPLGVYIPQGVKVIVGSGEAKTLPFTTCVQLGCVASLPIDSNLAAELSQSPGGRITLASGDGKLLPLHFSLRGYRDALAARAVDTAARS
jgi:invasion protein IalB